MSIWDKIKKGVSKVNHKVVDTTKYVVGTTEKKVNDKVNDTTSWFKSPKLPK